MRSGSWMLSDLCQQTGLLGRPEEYFRPDYRHHWSAEWGIATKRTYALYVASAIRHTSTPNGVFGVKMHAYQMNWFLRQLEVMWGSKPDATHAELLDRWLPPARYVHLSRRDVARQALSYYRAAQSNVWFEIREDDPAAADHNPDEPPTSSDEPDWNEVRYFEQALVAQERMWTRFFEETEIEPLEISYEDLADRPLEVVRRILGFAGVDAPADLTIRPRLKRQSDEATERWLEKYLACRDALTPRQPRPRRQKRANPAGGTEARLLFPDTGPQPAELGPDGYLDGTVSWVELVANLVVTGLPIAAAAALVDALPGEGAPMSPSSGSPDWRRRRTPLPAQRI